MKDALILELASRWEQEAVEPEDEVEDGSDEAKVRNAEARGRRQAKRECADAIRMLVDLIGDPASSFANKYRQVSTSSLHR